jgi:hypothetical protein
MRIKGIVVTVITAALLAGCSGGLPFGKKAPVNTQARAEQQQKQLEHAGLVPDAERKTIWDLFKNVDDPNVTLKVNKYIWQASLETLDFLPLESVDPFSGTIVYGYGTPPGGRRAYRATVLITDPSLDARSLNVALKSRAGAVPVETTRAIEDAILTRARQLRIQDGRL